MIPRPGWDSNPHITLQRRASYGFLTTPYHYGRLCVVVWTMSLPCFYKFRYALYSLYAFTRLFSRLSTKLSWTISFCLRVSSFRRNSLTSFQCKSPKNRDRFLAIRIPGYIKIKNLSTLHTYYIKFFSQSQILNNRF